jgi:hypothetical protein
LSKLSDRWADLRGASAEANLGTRQGLFKALKNTFFGPMRLKKFDQKIEKAKKFRRATLLPPA